MAAAARYPLTSLTAPPRHLAWTSRGGSASEALINSVISNDAASAKLVITEVSYGGTAHNDPGSATVSLNASGAMVASVVPAIVRSAGFGGEGTASAIGIFDTSVVAQFDGSGTVAPASSPFYVGEASLSGGGEMSSTTAPLAASSVAFSGDGNTLQSASSAIVINSALSGSGQTVVSDVSITEALTDAPSMHGALKSNMRASDVSATSGTTVASVTDRVNGGTWTQANEAAQPTFQSTGLNGRPALVFDGTNDFITASTGLRTMLSNKPGATIIVVGQTNNPTAGGNKVAFHLTTGGALVRTTVGYEGSGLPRMGGRRVDGNSFQFTLGSVPFTSGVPFLLSATFDAPGASMYIDVNGNRQSTLTFQTPGAFGSSTSSLVNIGSGANGEFWNGPIAEVLVYDRVLTSNEKIRVDSYVQDKYGLAAATYEPNWRDEGVPYYTATGAITGSGTTTAMPSSVSTASTGFSGSGQTSVSASVTAGASALLSGSGQTAAASGTIAAQNAGFSGSGSAATATAMQFNAVVGITGSGSATVLPSVSISAAALLSGSGSTATATSTSVGQVRIYDVNYGGTEFFAYDFSTSADFSGSGQVANAGSAGTSTRLRVVQVSYEGVEHEVIALSGSASFGGGGSLASSDPLDVYTDVYPGSPITTRTAATSGLGSLSTSRIPQPKASALFSGAGTATRASSLKTILEVTLTGSGTASQIYQADDTARKSVSFGGSGVASAGSGLFTVRTANFAGGGSVSRSQSLGAIRVVQVTGNGSISRTSTFNPQRQAVLSGEGTLVRTGGTFKIIKMVTFTASGSISATGFIPLSQFTYWDGTTEIPISLEGIWNGSTIVGLSLESVS